MKVQYLISPDEELNEVRICSILNDFQTRYLPDLNKLWKYYEGKQEILKKKATDTGKPCNKVVVNYCNNIVKNYLGYLTGIPINYSNDEFAEVLDILKYNDVATEDSEYLRNALICGRSFEVNYVDEEGKQRFRLFDTRNCIPVYASTLNNELLYVIRFYMEDELAPVPQQKYIVEVYGPNSNKTYKSVPGFTSLNKIDEKVHYYGQCPVTVFSLNEDEESIFKQIITLQDGYNELISGSIDDFDAFADAYLVLKGTTADSEDLESMKQNRVLMIDQDADAAYLTKDISNTQITFLVDKLNDQIHKIANSPDFNDEKFMAQSGEAIKYKLVGFENQAANIENAMKKALQRRIELICGILSLTNEEQQWRDVVIKFTRNLPNSLTPNNPNDLMQYKGLVSDETLLGLVPFVQDVQDEMNKVKEQKEENMDLYDFGNNEVEDDKEDNTEE